MPNTFAVHKTRAIDIDVVFYDNLDAANPANNVINTSVIPTVQCPSGMCNVGFRTDTRKVFIDGLTETTSPSNVIVSALGRSDSFLVNVLPPPAPPTNPAVVVGTGTSAEYNPATRP